MRVDLFDFELPPERIALRPAVPRHAARLLVVDGAGGGSHAHLDALPDFLTSGDVLVVNDSKVIPARLQGIRAREHSGKAQILKPRFLNVSRRINTQPLRNRLNGFVLATKFALLRRWRQPSPPARAVKSSWSSIVRVGS